MPAKNPLLLRIQYHWIWLLTVIFVPALTLAAAPKVVTTILPIHTLVNRVMQNVAIEPPQLLLNGAISPHDYALRPSDMRLLHDADVIFLIDKQFELFLTKPLANLQQLTSVELAQSYGIKLLPLRKTGAWQQSDPKHAHGGHHFDYHLWLDPRNAVAMANQISKTLSGIDPTNQSHYQANTSALIKQLEQLETDIRQILAPVNDMPYVVFHDAYQYFEHRFAMNAVGAVTLDPERSTSVKRIYEINNQIASAGAVCIFSEPQFSSRIVETLASSGLVKHAVLDPLGSTLTANNKAYFNLMTALAQSLLDCLTLTEK